VARRLTPRRRPHRLRQITLAPVLVAAPLIGAPLMAAPLLVPEAPPAATPGAAALLGDGHPLVLRSPDAATSPSPAPQRQPEPPSATPAANDTELVLDRRRRLLLVMAEGRELRRFPVAVGMPGWETPVGRFAVIEMAADPVWKHPAKGTIYPPGPANPLGSRWIGFHRDCRDRSGFNGQEHLRVKGCATAGFHGTNDRASVGRAASHGCVRLFDEHVKELYSLVRLGTPVTVLP
jgi:lipoprotein-anchoring transpeptidase ErfK/SrfK